MNTIYNLTTYNTLLCQLTQKGQTPSFQRLSLLCEFMDYSYFIHTLYDTFSLAFKRCGFVYLCKLHLCNLHIAYTYLIVNKYTSKLLNKYTCEMYLVVAYKFRGILL